MLMVAGDWSCLRERRDGDGDGDGDGDLGADEDRGASVGGAGGSSLTVVGCCGVWARDDTLDTVDTWGAAGDLAGSASVVVSVAVGQSQFIAPALPAQRCRAH